MREEGARDKSAAFKNLYTRRKRKIGKEEKIWWVGMMVVRNESTTFVWFDY
jgi:hypothetical protein